MSEENKQQNTEAMQYDTVLAAVPSDNEEEHEIFCPMCGESCGKGMGSGRIYMLHHTVGCKAAKRY